MIQLETTFSCVCPAVGCEGQLDAADWETAIAEVCLMHCLDGAARNRYIVCNVALTEYDEEGILTDLDVVTRSWRKVR